MANNISWIGGNQPSDPSTFDYDTAAQKVQRQRAAAQALQQFSQGNNQGQLIKNGDFIGFAGGNTIGSSIARIAAAALAAYTNGQADDSQKQLGLDSQAALQYQLDPQNSVAGQAAAQGQVSRENGQQNDRELARMQAGAVNTINPNSMDYDANPAQTPPMRQDGVTNPVALPPQSPAQPPSAPNIAAAASKAIGSAPADPAPEPTYDLMTGLPIGGIPTPASAPGTAAAAAAAIPAPASPQNAPTAIANAASAAIAPPAPPASAAGNTFQPVTGNGPVSPLPDAAPLAPPQPDPNQPQINPATGFPVGYTGNGGAIGDSRSMTQQAAANAQPTFAQQMAQAQAIARTGPMGQNIAQAQLQSMYSKDWGEIKNADGATIGVYNKRNPSEVQSFGNTGGGVKLGELDLKYRSMVDPNNPQSVGGYNQWRVQNGMQPISPQEIQGSSMSADSRTTTSKANAEAVSSIAAKKGEVQNQMGDLNKLSSDLGTGMALANKVGGKYAGVTGTIESFFGGGADQQKLERIINDSTLMGIMQDKGGVGTAGAGLMSAYQAHGLKATMTPEALQNGLSQLKDAVDARLAAKQAEVNAHDYALKALGYTPPAPAANNSTASTGRAPGNYPEMHQ